MSFRGTTITNPDIITVLDGGDLPEAERGRFDIARIHNLLTNMLLRLKAGEFKDLPRLVDVLRLHGFLPSFDAC